MARLKRTSEARHVFQARRPAGTVGLGDGLAVAVAALSESPPIAKPKAGLRRAGAGTRDALWAAIGHLLGTFSPEECRNYLANSGYEFE